MGSVQIGPLRDSSQKQVISCSFGSANFYVSLMIYKNPLIKWNGTFIHLMCAAIEKVVFGVFPISFHSSFVFWSEPLKVKFFFTISVANTNKVGLNYERGTLEYSIWEHI